MPPTNTHGSDTPKKLLTYGHRCVNGYLPCRSTSVTRLRASPSNREGGLRSLKRNKARLLPFNFPTFYLELQFWTEAITWRATPLSPTPVLLQESFHRLLRRLESLIKGS
ncbi:hypothetical protein CEXT_227841 [Caerostris extrusa]|uniref:Uncharacterized protein n=1 Tax=Caerostris extrusa TaxID=172846 RepID=A0AAV4NKL3_CAEEX|nr:hypothetical protein CEXT_227841 [Caerostris extrusa]